MPIVPGMKNKYAFLDLLLLAEVDGHELDIESIRDEVETFMFEVRKIPKKTLLYLFMFQAVQQ